MYCKIVVRLGDRCNQLISSQILINWFLKKIIKNFLIKFKILINISGMSKLNRIISCLVASYCLANSLCGSLPNDHNIPIGHNQEFGGNIQQANKLEPFFKTIVFPYLNPKDTVNFALTSKGSIESIKMTRMSYVLKTTEDVDRFIHYINSGLLVKIQTINIGTQEALLALADKVDDINNTLSASTLKLSDAAIEWCIETGCWRSVHNIILKLESIKTVKIGTVLMNMSCFAYFNMVTIISLIERIKFVLNERGNADDNEDDNADILNERDNNNCELIIAGLHLIWDLDSEDRYFNLDDNRLQNIKKFLSCTERKGGFLNLHFVINENIAYLRDYIADQQRHDYIKEKVENVFKQIQGSLLPSDIHQKGMRLSEVMPKKPVIHFSGVVRFDASINEQMESLWLLSHSRYKIDDNIFEPVYSNKVNRIAIHVTKDGLIGEKNLLDDTNVFCYDTQKKCFFVNSNIAQILFDVSDDEAANLQLTSHILRDSCVVLPDTCCLYFLGSGRIRDKWETFCRENNITFSTKINFKRY